MKTIAIIRPKLSIGGIYDRAEMGAKRVIEKEFTPEKDFLYKHVYLQATDTGREVDIEKLESLKKRRIDVIHGAGVACAAHTWQVFKDTAVPIVGSGFRVANNLGIKRGIGEATDTHFTSVEYMIEPPGLYKFSKEILPHIKNVGIILNEDMVVDKLFVESLLKEQNKEGFSVEPIKMTPNINIDDVKKYELLYGITGAIKYLPILIGWKKKIIMTIYTKYDNQIFGVYTPSTEIISEQIGEIICEIMKGKDIAKIPIQGPREYEKFVNIDVAKDLGIEPNSNMFKYQRKWEV
jgi:ABC-type uncharacterized transport system substrate-binding protein